MTETENWMSPEELRGIADYCDALNPLWDALTSGPKAGVTIECLTSLDIAVYDGNGDTLGRIDWGDDGPAFYPPSPTTRRETEPETDQPEEGNR